MVNLSSLFPYGQSDHSLNFLHKRAAEMSQMAVPPLSWLTLPGRFHGGCFRLVPRGAILRQPVEFNWRI